MTVSTAIPNRYGGTCTECSEYVAPREGTCAKVGGKWKVIHAGACPAPFDPRPVYGCTRIFTLAERLAMVGQRNAYLADKLGIVERSASLDEARRRIGESCQGMTMDYMTEFTRESEAAKLALEVAGERWPNG